MITIYNWWKGCLGEVTKAVYIHKQCYFLSSTRPVRVKDSSECDNQASKPLRKSNLCLVYLTGIKLIVKIHSTLINVLSQVLSGSSSTTALNSPVSSIDLNYLFWIVFVSGNISRCQGCSNKIMQSADGKALPPPNDLVVQHKEQVMFTNPNTGKCQLSQEHM